MALLTQAPKRPSRLRQHPPADRNGWQSHHEHKQDRHRRLRHHRCRTVQRQQLQPYARTSVSIGIGKVQLIGRVEGAWSDFVSKLMLN